MAEGKKVWPTGPPEVGQTAERSRLVEPEDIPRFTALSGDRNPLHYNEAWASASPFGEIIVQGGVTTAVLNAVVAEDLPGPGSVFLRLAIDFRAPVRPGDTITGRVVVSDVRLDKPITTVEVAVVRGDAVVAVEGNAVVYTVACPLGGQSETGSPER